MTFYINRERLDEHMEDLARQASRIRSLRGKLNQIIRESEEGTALYRSVKRLDAVEECCQRLKAALGDFSADTEAYARTLSDELDDLNVMINRLFE